MTFKQAPVRASLLNVIFLVAVVACVSKPTFADDVPVGQSRVQLDRTETFGVIIKNTHSNSMWRRELMREALLVAARSEMQLPVADIVIGEVVATEDTKSLELSCKAGTSNRIQLLQGARGKRTPVWTHEFTDATEWPPHRKWVERMEALSRTGFVGALEKANYIRRERPRPKDAAVELEPDLVGMIDGDLSFVSQFLALRKLHEATATDGETRARLAGLVRAYSHLGLLTEYQWHPMSHGFKARALLYAQRWTVRDPKSPLAMQHRAYAFALVGMHGAALEDLQTAAKLAADAPTKSENPAWIPLLEAYCRYDFNKLNELRADEQLKPLATLLYFLAYEQEGSRNLTVKIGMELLKDAPGCYRILDTLCHYTGPGAGQITTQVGAMHLASTLLPRLAASQDLPAHVRAALDDARAAGAILTKDSEAEGYMAEIEHRAKLVASLRSEPPTVAGSQVAAPDRIEPGWPVLAQMIEETSYLQVYRRAYFIRQQIGVPVDDYLEAYDKVVAKHRYARFIDLFRSQFDAQKVDAAIQAFDHNDNDFVQSHLWARWPQKHYLEGYKSALPHKEALPNEHGLTERTYDLRVNRGLGPALAVSPHSPYAMALALEANKKEETEAEKSWQDAAKKSPHLAQKFAEVWKARGDLAKSERFLILAAELDPSAENCRLLANHYKARGNDDKWLQALDDFLKTPSLGLQHAEVQCEIAKYYAERREWDKALPYADAAAGTGAQWAMNWARTANEVNQNWEAAERGYIAAIGRYGEHPIAWYLFCQRNGCGRLDVARKAAFPNGVEELISKPGLPPNYVAIALYFEGQPGKAVEVYEGEAKKAPASWIAMAAAIAADRAGDVVKRDSLLKLVVEQPAQPVRPGNNSDPRPHCEELVELARKLIADLAAGGTCDFKFNELHAFRDRAPERDHCSFNYFFGCYLAHRGKPDLAIKYWKQCMGAQDLEMSTRTAAGYELHQRGVKPSEWKPLLFAKPKIAK